MSELTLEYLTNEADLPQVVAMFTAELARIPYYNAQAKAHEEERYTLENLRTRVQDDPLAVIVARDGAQVVGFCISRFDDYTLWLEWIVADHARKRTGIGKLLLDQLVLAARQRGCHKIWCDCRTDNAISKSFLTRHGFTMVAELKRHWYQQDFLLLERMVG